MLRWLIVFCCLPMFALAQAPPLPGQQPQQPAPKPQAPPPPQFKTYRDDTAPATDAVQAAQWILDVPLPFEDNLTTRYMGNGQLMGWATRKGLLIRFFDKDGNELGFARRRTQEVTAYFAKDGTYIGRKVNQALLRHHEQVVNH